ncbi:signal peptidase I [Nocardioides yefusunii]|uniref:Signal peptidase I n=1 Tax=Nocardioides yefusunii TaxID=2500546 RepID=A0ABW1QWU5_9ACTN|nr:signal peptidase I [Nocardioides yefusunii]
MTSQDRDFPRPDDAEESRSFVPADSHDGTQIPDAAPAEEPRALTRKERKRQKAAAKKQLPLWQETILLLVLALTVAIVVKSFFIQAFYIPSESMEPGLVRNDRIVVQKISYWGGGEPQRGDVIVFKDPGGWLNDAQTEPGNIVAKAMTKVGLYPEGGHLVKRVVGVGGDVITCCDDDGRLKINGVAIDEPYVNDDPLTDCNGPMPGACDWQTVTVPEGHLFVMGDNRGHSADSSFHMCREGLETDCVPGREFVSTDLVVGRMAALVWPLGHARIEHRPDAFADVPDTASSDD